MPRKPALGGALAPTREDAQVSQDTVFEYSQRLAQQVIALERENVELQDDKVRLTAENRRLSERVSLLEKENGSLRDAGFATFQERHIAVRQAQESLQSKNGEVMLLRNTSEQQRQRAEALAADLQRLRGINERLQAERSQLTRSVLGLEATADAMQAQLTEQGLSEARAAERRGALERHVAALGEEKRRLDEQAGIRHVLDAQLRHAREELAAERGGGRRLREELQQSRGEAARLLAEAHSLEQAANAMRSETVHMRHSERAAASHLQRHREELAQEGACAGSLRARLAELEGVLAGSKRAQMKLEADNAALRTALDGARAEAHRGSQAAVELFAGRHGAAQEAERHGHLRRDAERRCETLTGELEQLRSQAEVLRGDHGAAKRRLQESEAECVLLRGQLRGAEAVAAGVRQECEQLRQQLPGAVLPGLSWMPLQHTPFQVGVA